MPDVFDTLAPDQQSTPGDVFDSLGQRDIFDQVDQSSSQPSGPTEGSVPAGALPDSVALKSGVVRSAGTDPAVKSFFESPLVPASVFKYTTPIGQLSSLVGAAFPNNPTAQMVKGFGEGVNQSLAGFTTPSSLPLLAIAPESKAAQLAAAGIFEGQALYELPQVVQAYKEAKTHEEKAKIITNATIGLGLPAAGMLHAAVARDAQLSPVAKAERPTGAPAAEAPAPQVFKSFSEMPDIASPEAPAPPETAAALSAIQAEAGLQLNKGNDPAALIVRNDAGGYKITDPFTDQPDLHFATAADAVGAAKYMGFEIDPRVLNEYGNTNRNAATEAEPNASVPREPTPQAPTAPEEPATPLQNETPAAPGRAPDPFGSEVTPVASHIINDIGGLMSKSTAKAKGLYDPNADLWDGAAPLSHPTHNKVYSATGETPDVVAQSLYDHGLIKEATPDAMWQALDKESAGARALVKQVPSTGTPIELTDPRQTTGVANRVLAAEAEAGHIDPIAAGEGMSWHEMVDKGRELLNGGADPQQIARRFAKNGRISADDFAVLRAERERLAVESEKAAAALRENPNAGTRQRALREARAKETAFVRDVVQPAKTATSDIFRGMQGEAPIDASTFEGLRRAVVDGTGKEPSPADTTRLKYRADEVRKAQQAEAKANAKLGDAIDQQLPKFGLPRTLEELRAEMSRMAAELLPCQV